MAESETPDEGDRKTRRDRLRRGIGLGLGLAAFAALLIAPPPEGVGTDAWRAAATASLMAIWWITEAIPIPATALVPLVAFPLLGIADIGAAAAPFANPLIFLFLGGFLISLAMQRWNLHRRIAVAILGRMGARPAALIGGFMLATALLSMWVSNTATAAMMVPIALSVLGGANAPGPGGTTRATPFAKALLLGIAYAASIGGLATIIGTPPNALLAGLVAETYGVEIGFAQWMLFGVPLAASLGVLVWWVLTTWLFKVAVGAPDSATRHLDAERATLGPPSPAEKRVAIVALMTAGLWILRPLIGGIGLSDAGIAMLGGLALFLLPSGISRGGALMDWEWARRLPWGVLILFGGGLSLAAAFQATGLAAWIGGAISGLGGWPTIAILATVVAIVIFLTELTSNTATAAAFLPLAAAAAVSLGENPLLFAAPVALAASCAFMMPVATPPNAIVFGSGLLTVPAMARAGFWINLIAIVAITAFAYTLLLAVFAIEPGILPDWARPAG